MNALRLAALRARIDELDRDLVATLAQRQRLVEGVARLKDHPTQVRDPARVERVVANVLGAATTTGLSASIAEPVWRLLCELCAAHEAAWIEARSGGYRDSCCGCEDGPRV